MTWMEGLTGLMYFFILLYASHQDLRTREIPDRTHVLILLTALLHFSSHPWEALIGAFLVPLPFLVVAVMTQGGIGGGDVKLMAANGFFLGLFGGVMASVIGLIAAVVGHTLFCTWKGETSTSIPMAPYLSCGCLIVFFSKTLF